MARSSRPIPFVAAVLLAALAAGCGSSHGERLNVVAIGNPADPFEKGVRLSIAGQLTRAAVTEGLVAFDEQGRVIPALADRWIVTDDGQSYIFRLRDGTWRDGQELSARAAVRSLQSAIRALRGTPLALDLADIAEIREMAGRVVEIRLSRPAPHLLQLLAQPELGLASGATSAGPMRLERQDDVAVLTPIPPQELGLPLIRHWDERSREIGLAATDGKDAVRRFNDGEADLVLGGTIATFPYTADVGILRGTIQLDPVDGLFGLQVVSTRGLLADPANREALSMAIDRDALIAPFGVSGWQPSTSLLPASLKPETAGSERWGSLTMEARQALAAGRIARWRGSEGEDGQPPVLRLALPPGPGSDMLFARLRGDLGRVGVTLERTADDDPADLRLIDVVSRYPLPEWYLNRFNCAVVGARGACSSAADEALAQARLAPDATTRAASLAEAETLLLQANVYIPFGSPIRWSLVRGDAVGFAANAWGWHPLMPMALLPK